MTGGEFEFDVDIRITIRPLVEAGVELVATYPDASYDRGLGRTIEAAVEVLGPKIAAYLAEVER